jgi:pimeloyl-ACP methyl ester carboxylesterase
MQQQARGHRQQTAATSLNVGQLYEVTGRRLWLHQSGTGKPAVVILAGASAVGLDYLNIHDRVSQFTTSVLYDRGGTGWSGSATLPRTATEVASELRGLLSTAGVPGPYLLAAHSLGGAYARRFAQMFPSEVASVLYVDSFYEDTDAYMPDHLHLAKVRQPNPGRLQLRLMQPFMRRMYQQMFAGWPEPLGEKLINRHLSREWWETGVRERSNMPELADELQHGGDLPDVPLIALVALGIDPGMRLLMSSSSLREMTEAKRRMYAALAGSVSHGECRILEGARHSTITIDCADAVVQAIRDLAVMAPN